MDAIAELREHLEALENLERFPPTFSSQEDQWRHDRKAELSHALAWAAIAQAEAATRQAAALERIAVALEEPPKMSLDMSDAIIRIADKINELRAAEYGRSELEESVAIFGTGE